MVAVAEVISLVEAGYGIARAIYVQAETYKLNTKHTRHLVERVNCVVSIIKKISPSNLNQQTLDSLYDSLILLNRHLTTANEIIDKMSNDGKLDRIKKFFRASSYKENLLHANLLLDRCVQLVALDIDAELLANYQTNSKAFLAALAEDRKEVIDELEFIEKTQTIQGNELEEVRLSLSAFYTELQATIQHIVERPLKSVHTLSFGQNLMMQTGAALTAGDISNNFVIAEGSMSRDQIELANKELIRRQYNVLQTNILENANLAPRARINIGNITSAPLFLKTSANNLERQPPTVPGNLGIFPDKASGSYIEVVAKIYNSLRQTKDNDSHQSYLDDQNKGTVKRCLTNVLTELSANVEAINENVTEIANHIHQSFVAEYGMDQIWEVGEKAIEACIKAGLASTYKKESISARPT